MASPSSAFSDPAALEVAEMAVPVDTLTPFVPETKGGETSDERQDEQQDEQQPTSSGVSLGRIAVLLGGAMFVVACFPICCPQRSDTSTLVVHASQIHVKVPHDNIAVPREDEPTIHGSAVIEPRDDSSFRRLLGRNDAVFVDFYAPWCVWCQRMMPAWEEFARRAASSEGRPSFLVARVDCTAHADLCREERIMAFPTLRLYRNGGAEPQDYKMDRTVDAFMGYAQRKVGIFVPPQLPPPPENNDRAAVQEETDLVNDDQDVAVREDDELVVDLDVDVTRAVERYERRDEETEVSVRGEDGEVGSPCDSCDTHEEAANPPQARVGATATELDPENYSEFVARDGFSFIAFHAPWCIWSRRMMPVWDDFAAEVGRYGFPVRIASVDCAVHADLCREAGILAFPTMRWYSDGKASVETYIKQDRTVVGFMEFARRKMGDPEGDEVAHPMLRGVHVTYGEMDDDVTEWDEAKEVTPEVEEQDEAKEVTAEVQEQVVKKEESFDREEDPDDAAGKQDEREVHEAESVHSEVDKAETSETEVIGISASASSDGPNDDEEWGVFDFDVGNWDPDHGAHVYEKRE